MLLIGNYNSLKVVRITATGAFLASEVGEVLLPKRFVPKEAEPGCLLDVFIYVDSEDRLTATTKKPKAVVGDFALLKVKDNVTVGTFLDWGLEKDLLLPFAEQNVPLRRGEEVFVKIYLHNSERIVASTKIDKFLQSADMTIVEGEQVDLIIYAFTELGAKVIINDKFGGLLFKNEIFNNPSIGGKLKAYVKKIREDGKIDLTLRIGGAAEAANDRKIILDAIKSHNGFLPLNDKSSPEAIAALLQMSKKSFKKAIGGLYKGALITILAEGIQIKENL